MVELLLSLILAVTGIERTVDPLLVADANRRVVEIQSDFSHSGMAYHEILHWNDQPNPIQYSIDSFVASPPHWAIMSDPNLTRIGCAVAVVEDITWIACSFGPSVVQLPPPVEIQPPAEAPPPPVVMLPNTAMQSKMGIDVDTTLNNP